MESTFHVCLLLFCQHVVMATVPGALQYQSFCTDTYITATQFCDNSSLVIDLVSAQLYDWIGDEYPGRVCAYDRNDCGAEIANVNMSLYNTIMSHCDGKRTCGGFQLSAYQIPQCQNQRSDYSRIGYQCVLKETTDQVALQYRSFCTGMFITSTQLCDDSSLVIELNSAHLHDWVGDEHSGKICVYDRDDCYAEISSVNTGVFNTLMSHCDGKPTCGGFQLPSNQIPQCQNQASDYLRIGYRCVVKERTDVGALQYRAFCTDTFITDAQLCDDSSLVIDLLSAHLYDWHGTEHNGRVCAYDRNDCGAEVVNIDSNFYNTLMSHCDGKRTCGGFQLTAYQIPQCNNQTSDYLRIGYRCLFDGTTVPHTISTRDSSTTESLSTRHMTIARDVTRASSYQDTPEKVDVSTAQPSEPKNKANLLTIVLALGITLAVAVGVIVALIVVYVKKRKSRAQMPSNTDENVGRRSDADNVNTSQDSQYMHLQHI